MTESSNPRNPGTRLRRRVYVFIALTSLLLAILAFFTLRADLFLFVQDPIPKADAIVVLGGEFWTRPQRAAELYASGAAPLLVASGDGDCDDTRRLLEKRGVPLSAIRLEPKSGSTKENAQFSIPLLREAGAKRVIIVTSWYHSRRALACFRKYGRDLSFYSCPTRRARETWWPDKYTFSRIWLEYAKTAVYLVRDGIVPF